MLYPCTRAYIPVFLLLGAIFSAQPVMAWSAFGHRAICDTAWRLSRPAVKHRLSETASRMGYNSFAAACVWADAVRGEAVREEGDYAWLASLHYVNLPKSATSAREANCHRLSSPRTSRPACILAAIPYFSRRLADPSLDRRQRDEALLLLGHFVGDLHQPLHVSWKEDRGGTRQPVTFEGQAMSLHQLWDSNIIACGFRDSWKRLGQSLFVETRDLQKPVGAEIIAWADESLELTRKIYRNLDQPLARNYCQQFHPLARQQLAKAALRLAWILEQTF